MTLTACPKCGPKPTRSISSGKRTRLECAGCSRFVRWEQQRDEASKSECQAEPTPTARPGTRARLPALTGESPPPAAGESLPPTLIPVPPVHLYVSRRLDLRTLPNDSHAYRAPVIFFDSTPFYRLTAGVFVWIESCGDPLADLVRAGKIPQGQAQLTEFAAVFAEVHAFAERWIPGELIRAARERAKGGGAKLPDHEPWETVKRRL